MAEMWSEVWKAMGKNFAVAKAFASNNPETVGSMLRWSMVGAGLGATRGAIDNMVGQDRVSIIGGAMQGALMAGGARGARIGMMKAEKMIKAGNVARRAARAGTHSAGSGI
jgi:hypothetical protein